jgi:hypothetical protein
MPTKKLDQAEMVKENEALLAACEDARKKLVALGRAGVPDLLFPLDANKDIVDMNARLHGYHAALFAMLPEDMRQAPAPAAPATPATPAAASTKTVGEMILENNRAVAEREVAATYAKACAALGVSDAQFRALDLDGRLDLANRYAAQVNAKINPPRATTDAEFVALACQERGMKANELQDANWTVRAEVHRQAMLLKQKAAQAKTDPVVGPYRWQSTPDPSDKDDGPNSPNFTYKGYTGLTARTMAQRDANRPPSKALALSESESDSATYTELALAEKGISRPAPKRPAPARTGAGKAHPVMRFV